MIDATGKTVIPGGIDPHIHSLWHFPPIEEGGEARLTDGPDYPPPGKATKLPPGRPSRS